MKGGRKRRPETLDSSHPVTQLNIAEGRRNHLHHCEGLIFYTGIIITEKFKIGGNNELSRVRLDVRPSSDDLNCLLLLRCEFSTCGLTA